MGCDIHMMVEKKINGVWEYLGEGYDNRNYDVFAVLADVRNGRGFAGCDTGDGFIPISNPRGIPEDASKEYRDRVEQWGGDGHSHSWLTVRELLDYDWNRSTKHRGWVSAKEYYRWKYESEPDRRRKCPYSWSGGVGGGSVKHISEEEMAALVEGAIARDPSSPPKFTGPDHFYCQVEWEEQYSDSMSDFVEDFLPTLANDGEPEDLRLVFFFDN